MLVITKTSNHEINMFLSIQDYFSKKHIEIIKFRISLKICK